jgi:hypothetical protein
MTEQGNSNRGVPESLHSESPRPSSKGSFMFTPCVRLFWPLLYMAAATHCANDWLHRAL